MCFLLSTSRRWDLYVYKTTLVKSMYTAQKRIHRYSQKRISLLGWQDLRSWSPSMLTAGLTRCFATDLPHSATSTSRFYCESQPALGATLLLFKSDWTWQHLRPELLGTLKARMPSPWHCRTLLEAPDLDMPVLVETDIDFNVSMDSMVRVNSKQKKGSPVPPRIVEKALGLNLTAEQ